MDLPGSSWARVIIPLISWSPNFSSAPASLLKAVASLSDDQLAILRRRRIDSIVDFALERQTPKQRLYQRLWDFQKDCLEAAIGALRCSGVDFLVFKGGEFVERYFASRPIGMLYDVDLLIHRKEVGETKRALFRAGFRQGVFQKEKSAFLDRDVSEVAQLELNHYELAPFAACKEIDLPDDEFSIAEAYNEFPIWTVGRKAFFVTEVDVHHGVSMDIAGSEFFKRSIPSAFTSARTLSVADHIWFTTSRYYTEVALHNKRSARDFLYLRAMLSTEEVDWESMISSVEEYAIRPAVYYYLQFLDRIGPSCVPSDIFEKLKPEPGSTRDWGWMLHTIFDGSPTLRLPEMSACRTCDSHERKRLP